MGTRIPKAHQTSWAQEAIAERRDAAPDVFRYSDMEQERIDAVMGGARMAPEHGPDMPVSPALGRMTLVPYHPMQVIPKGEDEWQAVPLGYRGRTGIRIGDQFDAMAEAKRARKKDAPPPFTPAQISVGRQYRTLFERREAGAVKVQSFDQLGGGGDFMDAFIENGRELDLLVSRIGNGASLDLRSVRPSKRGSRKVITDRAVVDGFCLHGLGLTAILKRHGWYVDMTTMGRIYSALCGVLDRMYGPLGRPRTRSWHVGC